MASYDDQQSGYPQRDPTSDSWAQRWTYGPTASFSYAHDNYPGITLPAAAWQELTYHNVGGPSSSPLASPAESGSFPHDETPHPTTTLKCTAPGCKSGPFRRQADLERHTAHAHPQPPRDKWYCDHQTCARSREARGPDRPFHRKDHYKAHLRDVHHEPIPRRRRRAEEMKGQPASQRRKGEWWRC